MYADTTTACSYCFANAPFLNFLSFCHFFCFQSWFVLVIIVFFITSFQVFLFYLLYSVTFIYNDDYLTSSENYLKCFFFLFLITLLITSRNCFTFTVFNAVHFFFLISSNLLSSCMPFIYFILLVVCFLSSHHFINPIAEIIVHNCLLSSILFHVDGKIVSTKVLVCSCDARCFTLMYITRA